MLDPDLYETNTDPKPWSPVGQMDGAPDPEDGVQMERICMDWALLFLLGQMDGAPEPEDGVQMERICMDVDGADLPFSDKCQCLK